MRDRLRLKLLLLILLIIAHSVVTIFALTPGHLLSDEAHYHWMTKSLSDRGSYAIWNGYEEFPSPELGNSLIAVHDGKLFPQKPYLFPLLAVPLYMCCGYTGLFLFNAIAFVGSVVLTFCIARRLFKDTNIALNSCIILILATYAWEYSQAAWPHSTAMFFIVAAFCLCAYAITIDAGKKSMLWCLASGLIAGFTVGIRLDTILIVPTLILPFLFVKSMRWKDGCAIALGTLPGMLIAAMVNHTRFGMFNPFTHGQSKAIEHTPPVGFVVIGIAVLVMAWLMTRKQFMEWADQHRYKLILLFSAVVLLAITLIPGVINQTLEIINNAWVSLVDIRALDPNKMVVPRTAGGGVVYIGALKKSLLQNAPFMVILFIPLIRIVQGQKDWPELVLLFQIPALFVAFFAYSYIELNGGGLSLNQRYFVECMPFLAILSAYAIKRLQNHWGKVPNNVFLTLSAIGTGTVFFLLTYEPHSRLERLEFPLLSLPLWIALGLALCVLAGFLIQYQRRSLWHYVAWGVLITALVWSGLVAFTYDYPHHRHARALHHSYGKELMKIVPGDSLFFTDHAAYSASTELMEKDRIRIANPFEDKFADFPKLLAFHIGSGRPVYALFRTSLWIPLERGPLQSYKTRTIFQTAGFTLKEILKAAEY